MDCIRGFKNGKNLMGIPNSIIPIVSASTEAITVSFPLPLSPPALIEPKDGESFKYDRKATLKWGAVEAANEYEIEFSLTSDFSPHLTKIFRTASTEIEVGNPESSLNPMPAFDGGRTYSWRVRGYSTTDKVSSAWSDVWEFSTQEMEYSEMKFSVGNRPKIIALSAADSTIKHGSSTTIKAEYSESGGSATNVKWRSYYIKKNGNLVRDDSPLSSEQLDSCTFTAPDADDSPSTRWSVRLKAWNDDGSDSARTEVNITPELVLSLAAERNEMNPPIGGTGGENSLIKPEYVEGITSPDSVVWSCKESYSGVDKSSLLTNKTKTGCKFTAEALPTGINSKTYRVGIRVDQIDGRWDTKVLDLTVRISVGTFKHYGS